jgi:CRISPR-associated protein Cmr6
MESARRLGRILFELEKCEHTGLALDTLLENHGKIPSARGSTEGIYESKHFKEVASARVPEVYTQAFRRWKESFDPEKVKTGKALVISVTTSGPLAIGLGNESPLEVGLSLHHTYGVPYLPGSAIKGLMTRAADRYGISTEHKEILFGSMKSAAHVVYWDGWLEPSSAKPLQHDVITVHHPDYYGSQGKNKNDKEVYPTDFDDPNPVSFLSVRPGSRFCIVLSSESEGALEWLNMAGEILKYALEEMGLGAKTNSGYGYFAVTLPEKIKSLAERQSEKSKQYEKQINGINGRSLNNDVTTKLVDTLVSQLPESKTALESIRDRILLFDKKHKLLQKIKVALEGDV